MLDAGAAGAGEVGVERKRGLLGGSRLRLVAYGCLLAGMTLNVFRTVTHAQSRPLDWAVLLLLAAGAILLLLRIFALDGKR